MEIHTGTLDNGLTLRIPETFASELGLEPNSPVDVALHGCAIIVRRAKEPRVLLDDLLERVTEQNRHGEIDTGEAIGREIW